MKMKLRIVLLFMFGVVYSSYAQDKKVLPLDNMDAFQSQVGNWQIVGKVLMNPDVDIHKKPKEEPVQVEETSKKKKKKKKNAEVAPPPVVEEPKAVTFEAGTGILLNMNDETQKDHLLTKMEHGDIELEMEVMLPKGSNSGLYLQGRYEVQLFDSWGVRQPKYSDIGGIYRNWETEPGQIYSGKAPLTNAAKAPGLWQKISLLFKAPRFDANGKKIANAQFVYVDLNGQRIHNNVEVPLPTGGPIKKNEVAKGPIMIQGDHGPVAIRNFRYKLLSEVEVSLSDVTYQAFEGKFKNIDEFVNTKPSKEGTSKLIDCGVSPVENRYGLVFKGNIEITEADEYTFTVGHSGGVKFVLDGKDLINYQAASSSGKREAKVKLEAGKYPFELYNFKSSGWHAPRLGLFAQGSSSYPVGLHEYESYPEAGDMIAPILHEPSSQPKLLRGFVDFWKDEKNTRLSHTIGVGNPSGVHYVYDLNSANLVLAWKGDFADVTPMWHDRGNGSFKPRGAKIYTFLNHPLASLSSETAAFPKDGDRPKFQPKGYKIEEGTGQPLFQYTYDGVSVSHKITPVDYKQLDQELTLEGNTEPLFYKIAEGNSIEEMQNGNFAIDDQQYYVKVVAGGTPQIREVEDKKELFVKIEGNSLKWALVW